MHHLSVRARALGVISLLATVGLSLGACGSSPAAGAGTNGGGRSARIPAADRPWTPSPKGKWDVEPKVVVPSAAPPTHLVKEDLITGTGAVAKPGDLVTVQYVGVSYTTKKVFDASWNRHTPYPFQLGAGQVIKGWDEGVAGMRVGGRRELIIPPALAYGDKSPGPGIAANDTLIFIVDLLNVQSPQAG